MRWDPRDMVSKNPNIEVTFNSPGHLVYEDEEVYEIGLRDKDSKVWVKSLHDVDFPIELALADLWERFQEELSALADMQSW